MKACPFCAEEIQDAAIVCKHCGRNLLVAGSIRLAVNVAQARLRAEPSMTARVLGIVTAGTIYDNAQEHGDWFKVTRPNGETGYLSATVVRAAGDPSSVREGEADGASRDETGEDMRLPTLATESDPTPARSPRIVLFGVFLLVASLCFPGHTGGWSIVRIMTAVAATMLIGRGRVWVKLLVGSGLGLFAVMLWVPASTLLPTSPGASPPSGRATLDKSPQSQRDREALLQKLVDRDVFEKSECGRPFSRVWVEPLFYSLDFDQKNTFVSDVFAYCFDGSNTLDTVDVIDAKTGRSIGDYSHLNPYPGLKLR